MGKNKSAWSKECRPCEATGRDSGVIYWLKLIRSRTSSEALRSQATRARVMLRIASPIRNTAAIKDASGKNLAMT